MGALEYVPARESDYNIAGLLEVDFKVLTCDYFKQILRKIFREAFWFKTRLNIHHLLKKTRGYTTSCFFYYFLMVN